jgi:hypothetical protein
MKDDIKCLTSEKLEYGISILVDPPYYYTKGYAKTVNLNIKDSNDDLNFLNKNSSEIFNDDLELPSRSDDFLKCFKNKTSNGKFPISLMKRVKL